jgi:hypothetical protein
MSLFQESIIRKHLGYLDQELVDQAYLRFKKVYSPNKISNIKTANEEQYQEGFIKDIFGEVLGYSVFPDQPFNIQTEKKNEANSKKADGAIFQGENVVGVIELKDNKTKNLDAVKDQAFGYKNNHKECSYVISSNFHKLRLYVDDATDYEEFDLYNLDKDSFKRFYLYLHKECLLDKNIPKLLKSETKFHEENITKSLYKDYSSFKHSFFQNVVKNNPQYDKLLLFKKSQKFLDKVLFVLFAEDKGLVSTNSIVQIVEKWNNLKSDAFDTPKPLYHLIALFFNNLFIGKKDQKGGVLIPEFGGEIFAPDEVLDTLMVDDEVLQDDLLKLSKYDFNTDVDVNILGHIFEHSLSEIEEVEASLKGEVADKIKGKRKKDGVFYTPKYITKYIVENTIGTLCAEKKTELELDRDIAIFEYQKADGKLNAKGIELYTTLNKYKDWLLTLKILDPACGSGAFLNQAVNYLVQEHAFVDDIIAELTNSPLRLHDTDIAILENNIYGVDINEESIEIAKLSLWLRTARKGRKLSNLSNNIKCGNSLIDDPEVAGDKAFNWHNEFPEVFANGGFDVVIGNPPYVRVEFIDEISVNYFKNKYKSATSKFDLSSLFFEKSISLLNPNGIYSIITSYQFIYTSSGIGLRKFISENTDCEFIKFSSESQVFSGVTTYAGIFIARRNKSNTIVIKDANNLNNSINILREFKLNSSEFSLDKVILDSSNIISKIEANTNVILGFKIGMAKTGVVSSADEIFFLSEEKVKELNLERELIYPILGIDDLNPWILDLPQTLCLYPYKEIENKTSLISLIELNDKYPNIYNYLLSNKEKLSSRSQGRQDYSESGKWYQLNRPREKWIYDSRKIIYPGTTNRPKFAFDLSGQMFRNARVYGFLLKEEYKYLFDEIVPILNSSLTKYLLTLKCPPKANNYFEMSTGFMEYYPFILPQNDFKIYFQNVSKQMKELHTNFNIVVKKIQRSIERKFELQILPKKLQDWYLLSYADFIKELGKKKIKLSLSEEAEWEMYFTSEAKKALELKAQIEKTDKEIDQMVYALYELTEDEIKIVEAS